MFNESLWLAFLFFDLAMVVVLYRLFGRMGLYGLIAFNLVLCNIQVLKTVELFGFTTTLGNIMYGSIFLATDMLNEFYGKKEARRAIYLGFFVLLLGTVYMQIALLFTPAPDDFAQDSLATIFGFYPRVALASMAAYLISQLHDVWAFDKIRAHTGEGKLWLRNTLSTTASQLLDSVIFCTLAFVGVFPTPVLLEIMLTTFVFKLAVAFLDTPFIYLARRVCGRRASHCPG